VRNHADSFGRNQRGDYTRTAIEDTKTRALPHAGARDARQVNCARRSQKNPARAGEFRTRYSSHARSGCRRGRRESADARGDRWGEDRIMVADELFVRPRNFTGADDEISGTRR